ncbi:DUF192 domain-containing protein [Bdellovibrio sp. SKB1291214]|uniref:DUF192 domain-containing protein n=1 Tax=Bdellovibrio sp. SKB1291214 TaxID=1732569 RepID=UPI000B51B3FE|nr:DUF192 domain-containing protein [Bdellovibrio sp. SKB1291214]UYL10494.1 DUF192 domain-containing protein [Bdellovibrio sp. SKB1291214]
MASLLRCFVLGIILSFALVSGAAENFPKKTIKLGNKTLTVEVATTSKQQEQGLMMRTHLGEDEGMLFVFPNEQTRFFWMKDTLIDLSIAYFNKDGKLIDIQEMKSGKGLADTALPNYASAQPAKYALEMNKGWFDKNKIKLGTKLKINP